jgi:DNA-directed RNA polymerase specialized sigma24 family protein
MGQRPFIRIGTRTTPRKKSAIKAAREGRMEKRHLDYVLTKYHPALFYPLLNMLGTEKKLGFDLAVFVDDCIEDAFIRIKEYDEQYRFRSFLIKKVVWPALSRALRASRKEHDAILEYLEEKEVKQRFEQDYRNEVAKEFVTEALLKLREQDPVKHQVFCKRYFEKLSFPEIYRKLKTEYPLSITSVQQLWKHYERAKKELKHIFRELIRNKQYVDDDLPFDQGLKRKFHQVTTKGKPRA